MLKGATSYSVQTLFLLSGLLRIKTYKWHLSYDMDGQWFWGKMWGHWTINRCLGHDDNGAIEVNELDWISQILWDMAAHWTNAFERMHWLSFRPEVWHFPSAVSPPLKTNQLPCLVSLSADSAPLASDAAPLRPPRGGTMNKVQRLRSLKRRNRTLTEIP